MFLIDKETEITAELICKYIQLHHEKTSVRYKHLQDYYEGKHDILLRRPQREGQACNNMIHNYAKYISDFASGYLIGEPAAYSSEENIDNLLDYMKKAQTDVQDTDNAKDQSIYGVAYELVYMSNAETPTPKTANIHPSQAFVIYDNSVELNSMCGVYYYEYTDPISQDVIGFNVSAVTPTEQIQFKITTDYTINSEVTISENPFNAVTLIEIWNNKERQGDFEQVISLIDGYNKQQSTRVDEAEDFVNSLMVLKGQIYGDTAEEKAESVSAMKRTGVVELSEEGDLQFLTRQQDQQGNELIRQSIADDIHKFSYVPSLTDKDFASNISGVAMQFKLMGLNQITKAKERYIKEGIRERIKLFNAILSAKAAAVVAPEDITITLTHSLPKNLVEIAQVVGNLQGICSNETLLAQIPFVEDPKAEAEKAAEERQQRMDDEFVMSTPKIEDISKNEAD